MMILMIIMIIMMTCSEFLLKFLRVSKQRGHNDNVMIMMIIMINCSEFFLKFWRVSKQVRYQMDIKVEVEWMRIYLSNTSRKLGFTMMMIIVMKMMMMPLMIMAIMIMRMLIVDTDEENGNFRFHRYLQNTHLCSKHCQRHNGPRVLSL